MHIVQIELIYIGIIYYVPLYFQTFSLIHFCMDVSYTTNVQKIEESSFAVHLNNTSMQ